MILKEKDDKIQELLHEIHTKNVQMQFNNNDDKNKQNKSQLSAKLENEKALFVQLEEEKQKVSERDIKIESLLEQLEDYHLLQQELNNIKEEFQKYQELTQQDLAQQSTNSKAIEKELIALAARNSALETEKQDLLNILEQRDYESIQLKSLIDLSKSQHHNGSGGLNKISMDETGYHNNTLEFIMNENVDDEQQDNYNDDNENASDTMYEIDNENRVEEDNKDNNENTNDKKDEVTIDKINDNGNVDVNANANKNVIENEVDNMNDMDNDIDSVINDVMEDMMTPGINMQSKDYLRLKEERKKKKFQM